MRNIFLFGLLGLSMAALAASDADEYYADAQQKIKEKDVAAAVIQLKNALQSDPGHGPSRVLLGTLSLDYGDPATAEKEFRRARAIGVPPEQWELLLGEAYLEQGKFNELIAEFSLDDKRAPARQAAIAALHGEAFLGQGSSAAAEKHFELALEIRPGQPRALLGKARLSDKGERPSEALEYVNKAIAAKPENADAHAFKGRLLLQLDEEEAALKVLNKAIQIDPGHRDALFERARYFAEQRKHEQALKDIAVLRQRHPAFLGSSYLGSVVAFQIGDFESAQDYAGAVLRVSPNHARTLVLYGVSALLLGQEETAQDYLTRAKANGAPQKELDTLLAAVYLGSKSYDRVIEVLGPDALRSNNVQNLVLLGSAYLGKGNRELGQRAYGRAIEIAPTLTELRTQLGIRLMQLGDKQLGIDILSSAVDHAGNAVEPEIILVLGHLDQGNIPAAKEAALALEKSQPNNIRVLTLTGVVLLAAVEQDAALSRFDKVLSIDKGNVNARVHKARVFIAQKNNEAARRQFEQILEIDATNFDALTGLIALADQEENTEQTEYWVGRARQAKPGAVQPGLLLTNHYLRHGQPEKALKVGREMFGSHPQNHVVLYQYARALTVNGQPDVAVEHLKTAAQLEPQSTAIWSLLATTQLQIGDINGALKSVDRLLAMDPRNIQGMATRAAIELRRGDVKAAMGVAEDLRDAHPQRPEGNRLIGTIAASNGDLKTAEVALDRAYSIEKSGNVARLLSSVLARNGRIDDAKNLALDWLSQSPGDLETRRQLAVMLQQNDRPVQAAEQYEAMLALRPDDYRALNNLAWIRYESSDPSAVVLARRAYEASPGNSFVMDTYGWILFRTEQNKAEALRLLKEAYLVNPNSPDIGFHLATVSAAAGERQQARSLLRSLLLKHPNFQDAAEARALLAQLDG